MTQNTLTYFVILSMALTFTACKKELIEVPEDQTGDPVFSIDYTIDDTNFRHKAGIEDYYMETSYEEDADQVLTYIGNFTKKDCAEGECNTGLQFEIRSTQFAPQTSIENDLLVMNYGYKDNEIEEADIYQVKLDAVIDEEDIQSFTWRFVNEDSIQNQLSIIRNFPDDGEKIDPRFIARGKYGQIASKGKNIPRDGSTPCDGALEIIDNQDNTFTFQVVNHNIEDPFYLWFYGDSTKIDPTITLPKDSLYNWEVSVLVNDAVDFDNCFVDITRTFSEDSAGNIAYSDANYDGEVLQKIEGGTRYGFTSFAIQYTDENGKIYRSDTKEQPTQSYFRITSIEDYLTNAAGDATKKLGVEYHCQVFAEDGSILPITNGIGTIAVAYPD